jgi:phosphoribosylanthranilate isomerase
LEWLSDWSSALPWWLAGGITPENVSDVLKGAQPDGVDVSSGVEDRPGWKNLERVERLLTEAQINRPPNRD